MAKMFGFLDFTKAGPGVDKQAPKKRSLVVFFEILGRKFWNLVYAGMFFLLVNLPLITRGWADAGLTYITRAYSREKHAFVKEDFFETIRKNRGQAFWCGLINLVVTAVLVFNITYYLFGMNPYLYQIFGIDTTGAKPMIPGLMDYVVMASTAFGYVIFTFMKYYIPFLVITFRLTTKQVYRNAMILSMAGIKQNLLISAVLLVIYVLFFLLLAGVSYAIVYVIVGALWMFVLPPVRSLLIQYTIFPVIKELMIDPYYRDNPDADKQQRLDLNLEVEDPTQEAPVFTDTAPTPEPEKNTIPRQYSEADMRRARRHRATQAEEDDGTI